MEQYKKIAQEDLHLRPVTNRDSKMLFAWRNDEEARLNSRHTAPITREEHDTWLRRSFKSTGRLFFIAELKDLPVGVVRADPREDGSFEISYTVAPEWRGHGIAKAMTQLFASAHLEGKRFVAVIKRGSVASEKVAEALGLSPIKLVPSDSSDSREFVEWR